MTPEEDRTREFLRLARDTCTGIAAFLARAPGDVTVVVSPSDAMAALDERIVRLAESTLAHPRAADGDLIWNAEPPEVSEPGSESIACVAVPCIYRGEFLGVMGVVDFWLPDIDDELRGLLLHLADELAASLAGAGEVAEAAPGRPSWPERAADSESFLSEVADHLPDGIVIVRDDGTILYANRTFATLSHRLPEELLGRDVLLLVRDRESSGGSPQEQVVRLFGSPVPGRRATLSLPGGRDLPVDVRGRRLSNRMVGDCFAALVRDARQPIVGPAETSAPVVLEELLENIEDGVIVCDDDARVVIANRAARLLQGLTPEEEIVGRPFPFSTELRSSDGALLRYEEHPLLRALHGTTVRAEHLVLEDNEGNRRHLLASARPFAVGGTMGALLVMREITAQLDEEARLMQLALHDPLTGLANRYLLLDHLQRTFRQIRSRGGAMALLYLDLDDFKSINDDYGHDVGDEVLVAVARRLQGAARASDLVARLSGDEFVIVAHSPELERDSIDVVTARIRKVLTAPYHIRDKSFSVGASVGWVLADPHTEEPMTLMVRADEEMYRRKQARRTRRGSEGRP